MNHTVVDELASVSSALDAALDRSESLAVIEVIAEQITIQTGLVLKAMKLGEHSEARWAIPDSVIRVTPTPTQRTRWTSATDAEGFRNESMGSDVLAGIAGAGGANRLAAT